MNMIKKKGRFPVIGVPFTVLIYKKPMDLLKELGEDIRLSTDPRDFNGGVFEIDGMGYIALLNNKHMTQGIIAHECKHLVNLAFTQIGFHLDAENDEMECYYLKWIVDYIGGVMKNKK